MNKHGAAALTVILILFFSVAGVAADESELNNEYLWDQFIKVFNLAIVVAALIYFLKKPIVEFFKRRGEQIETDLNAAKKAREEAEAKLAEVKTKIDALEVDIARIMENSRLEGEREKQLIIDSAKAEAERVIASAELDIKSRIKAGQSELKIYAAELAVERARQLLRDRIDEDLDRQLIEKSLEGIGEVQ